VLPVPPNCRAADAVEEHIRARKSAAAVGDKEVLCAAIAGGWSYLPVAELLLWIRSLLGCVAWRRLYMAVYALEGSK